MKKKNLMLISIMLILLMTATLFSGCDVKQGDSTQSAVPTATIGEINGDNNAISNAGFSVATVKQGDKVSNFIVTSVEIKESDSGDVSSCKVEFDGKLTVYGTYQIIMSQDDRISKCEFYYTDDLASYIPHANEFENDKKLILLDAQEMLKLYSQDSGTAAVVIDSYTYSYDETNGIVQTAKIVEKAQSDYVIIE